MDGTKPITLRMKPGDKERINRTKRILERDIAKLERQLAHRRSKEGQEATRATILSKRARVHRLNDYLKVAAPHQVQKRVKPIPTTHVQRHVPPKGSQKLLKRMEQARKNLRKGPARPPVIKVATPVIKTVPKVVDERSARKAVEVAEANKKAVHEAKIAQQAVERKAKIDIKPKVKEVPKPPTLTPMEKEQLQVLPKQLAHLQKRQGEIKRLVDRMNSDGYMRFTLMRFQKSRNPRYAREFTKRRMSLKESLELRSTKRRTTVNYKGRSIPMQELTHPDILNIPQKMKSIHNRLDFLKAKQAGLTDRARPEPRQERPKVQQRNSQGTTDAIAQIKKYAGRFAKPVDSELSALINEAIKIAIESQPKTMRDFFKRDDVRKIGQALGKRERELKTKSRQNLGGFTDPRPYAMSRGLGMLTVNKHRQSQRLHRPKVESNNMNGLRRYTNAQYAREQRERVAQEADKQVANLAGAFSQTRAVMERLVR